MPSLFKLIKYTAASMLAVIVMVIFIGVLFTQAEKETEWRKDRLCKNYQVCGE